jgi:hypothetical protein
VTDEVLQGGENMFLVAEIAVALEAAHGGDAEARDQVGVLAVGLFHAAPARLTGHVDDRGEGVVRAADTGLECRHGEELLDEVGVEGGAERNGLRKAGAVGSGVSVQAFLVEHDGDAEARVLEEELLDGVGQFRHGARFLAATGVGGTADLAEAAAVAKGLLRFGEIEVALFIDQLLGLLLPDAEHLHGLLFEGHAGEQVFDAARGGKFGILVSGQRGFARGTCESRRLLHGES